MNSKPNSFPILKILLAASLMMIAFPVQAALNAYMEVTGETQGPILGDVTQTGREDLFIIHEMHHLIRSGDQTTVHEPLILITTMSRSMPLLLTALDTRESLDVTIKFWRPMLTGQETMYYTFVLGNARLVAAEPIMLDNKNPEYMQYQTRVRLRFEYQSITHFYEPEEQSAILQNR